MSEFIQVTVATFSRLDVRSLVDILLVAGLAYWLLTMMQGTTAVMLIRGIVFLLLAASLLGNVFGLTMLNWLVRNSIPALLVAIPILFQPELRRTLEHIGRAGGFLPRTAVATNAAKAIDVVATAAHRLAERRWGALIVLERETALGEYAETGVPLDAQVSVEVLLSIFFPNAPLHDGAVILRGDRVVAAGCVLPLGETVASLGHQMGTRHRAAIGITERTDAISVVVSEETGQISIANNGRMVRNLDEARLHRVLTMLFHPQAGDAFPRWLWGSRARA